MQENERQPNSLQATAQIRPLHRRETICFAKYWMKIWTDIINRMRFGWKDLDLSGAWFINWILYEPQIAQYKIYWTARKICFWKWSALFGLRIVFFFAFAYHERAKKLSQEIWNFVLGKLRCVCAAVITKSETKTRKPDKWSQRNENERSAVEMQVDFVPGAPTSRLLFIYLLLFCRTV